MRSEATLQTALICPESMLSDERSVWCCPAFAGACAFARAGREACFFGALPGTLDKRLTRWRCAPAVLRECLRASTSGNVYLD